MTSLRKYEDFLKLVKEKNQDEFSELGDILTRYNTLEETNRGLKYDL